MAINISDNLLSKTTAPADAKWGPYFGLNENEAKTQALNYLIPTYRYEGLTVGLKIGDLDIVEYWFIGGTLDEHLGVKTVSVSGTTSGETGQSIVSKLRALPLNEKLVANDITYNSISLKTFLDSLNVSGGTNGDLEINIKYDGNFVNGIVIQLYNSNNVLVNTITTSDTVVFTSIPNGTYNAKLLLLSGYVSNEIIVDDNDNSNNIVDLNNNTISGITISSDKRCTINVTLFPDIVPILTDILINNGDDYSSVSTLNITVDSIGLIDSYMISESPAFIGAIWLPYHTNITYFKDYISETNLTLYFIVKNIKGISNVVSDSITLTNGFHRSDSNKTYNNINTAVSDIYNDYGGNLTQDVKLSCVGSTINTRTTSSYLLEIIDFNVASNNFLIIDGGNDLILNCASLGGIKIKNSKNILIRNINFTKVATELTTAVPEELAAVYVLGISTAKCSNVAVENCTISCIETYNGVTKGGSYGIIAKNIDNMTIVGCSFNNVEATIIKASFVDNLNIVKNLFIGSQAIGIVSQPCHVSSTNGNIINITDNNFNGTTFDTGLILDAITIKICRNRFYNFKGECIRMNNTSQGKLLNINTNVFYSNLLAIPYSWVKYTILLTSGFDEVDFISNTVEMHGINYSGLGESLIRGYACEITKLIFSNNIIRFKYPSPPYINNAGGGNVLNLDMLTTLISNHNVYIDNTVDGNTVNTAIINNKKKITDLNILGYDINSIVLNYGSSIFTNESTHDYHLTSNGNTLTASLSGNISDIDFDYKSGSTNAGAYGYGYISINELDTNTDYRATNIASLTNYTVYDTIQAFSTDSILFETLNMKRDVLFKWIVTNRDNPEIVKLLLGVSGLVNVVSNIMLNGNYLSDATYNIEIDII